MTDTELEALIDLPVTEFTTQLTGMSTEGLQQVRSHPVVVYFLYRIYSAKKPPTTAEEWEEELRFKDFFPCSREYYLAQAQISDHRWKFQCQVGRLGAEVRT